MGARLRLGVLNEFRRDERVRIDIKRDPRGEYFDLAVRDDEPLRIEVIDVRPDQRHLLLMVASPAPRPSAPAERKQKFLCGHDERTWFVAAVPESAGASNVLTAMEALKPRAAQSSQERHGVRFRDRNRRKNAGFVRQGEWFFVPEPHLVVPAGEIVRNERIQRSGVRGSKPHVAEFGWRSGGEGVYVNPSGNRVLSPTQHRTLAARNPAAARGYLFQLRNARLVVKGRISHSDHATILLRGWHSVWMNTENEAEAMRSVAFID
jgi:hypothetical protein